MVNMFRKTFFILYCIWFAGVAMAQDGDGLSYYVNAEKLRQANNLRGALDEYDKAIQSEPNNYKFVFQKGKCYIMLNDEANAIYCFERTIRLKEDFVQAHARLGWLYQKSEKYPDAIAAFDRAFRYEQAVEEKLNYKMSIIKILYKTNQFDKSGSHIEDARKVLPDHPEILFFSAKLNNQKKNYEAAKADMLRAIPLLRSSNPQDVARFYYELGYAYYQLGDYAQAKSNLDKANIGAFKSKVMELTPQYHFSVATAYFKIYQFDKCKELLSQTLKMDRSFAQAHDLLVKMASVQTDKGGVIVHQREAVQAEADAIRRSARLQELAEMLHEAGKYQEAISVADECLALNAGNYTVKFIRAMSKYRLGQLDQGKKELTELSKYTALDFETKAQCNFALGMLCRQSGDAKGAIAAFRLAQYGSFKYAAARELRDLTGGEE